MRLSCWYDTLPLRRLALKPGASAEVTVVYLALPEMQVTHERQRYTRSKIDASGGRYKFESLDSGFTADLSVAAEELVEDYPELFRRVWSG